MDIIPCQFFVCKWILADVHGALGNHIADRSGDCRHARTNAGNLSVAHNGDRFVFARPNNLPGHSVRIRDGFQRNRLTDCFAEYLLDNENGDLVFVEIPPLEPSINLAKRLNICNTFFIPVEKDEQSKRLRHRGMTSAEVFERLVLQSEEFVKNLPGYVKLTGTSQNYGEPYQRFAAEIIDHIQRGK